MKKTIYIEGDGCNRRLLEMTKIKSFLEANSYEIVKSPVDADYILAGTCAFKEREENNSVSRLRDLKKYKGQLLVYGCLPDIAPGKYDEFSEIKKLAPKNIGSIDSFFDDITKKFEYIPDFNTIENVSGNKLRLAKQKIRSKEIFGGEFYGRGVASLKECFKRICCIEKGDYILYVSRGCMGKCTYCAIRNATGPVQSKSLEQVKDDFLNGIKKGYRSFTILGDDPGCYGLDNGSTFPELLELLTGLAEKQNNKAGTEGINFSVNEIHPKFLTRYASETCEIIRRYPGMIKSILCPIQSGSDRILGLMQREHSSRQISNVIKKIRSLAPDLEFSTHVMVGFPTENREDLEKSWALVKDCGFKSVVIFPYHDKQHTPAASLGGKVAPQLIRAGERESLKYFRKAGIKAYKTCPK